MQVVRLQERSSSYLAELDELKTARSSKSLLGAVAGDAQAAGTTATGAVVAAKSAAADKELMLKQIDSLKEVRPYHVVLAAGHQRSMRQLLTSAGYGCAGGPA